MNAVISFCSTPRPAIIGAAIAIGGCAALPCSVTAGAAVAVAGLVVTTAALAAFEVIRNMDREIEAARIRSQNEKKQFESKRLDNAGRISFLVVDFLKLKPQSGLCPEKLYNEAYWQNQPFTAFEMFEPNLIVLIKNSIWDELKNKYVSFLDHCLKLKTLPENILNEFKAVCVELNQLLNQDPSQLDLDAQKSFIEKSLERLGKLETLLDSHPYRHPNFLEMQKDCTQFKEIIARCSERLRLAGEIERAHSEYQGIKNN